MIAKESRLPSFGISWNGIDAGSHRTALTVIANTVIADGQPFCAFASGPAAGAVVVNAADKSVVTVTGKAEDLAAAACPIVNGIKGFPVSPPANPAALPVVATTAPASWGEERGW